MGGVIRVPPEHWDAGGPASGSLAIVTPRGRSGPFDLDERPAELTQALVDPNLHATLGLPLAARRRSPAPPALDAPVEDDLDLVEGSQGAHEVLVQRLVVPRHDEPISPHAASVPALRARAPTPGDPPA